MTPGAPSLQRADVGRQPGWGCGAGPNWLTALAPARKVERYGCLTRSSLESRSNAGGRRLRRFRFEEPLADATLGAVDFSTRVPLAAFVLAEFANAFGMGLPPVPRQHRLVVSFAGKQPREDVVDVRPDVQVVTMRAAHQAQEARVRMAPRTCSVLRTIPRGEL